MKWQPDGKILIQGITEPLAAQYVGRMKAYGTNIVAGVSVGQGGQQLGDIPVFDLVAEALAEVGEIETSLIFVQPYAVLDAALEAIAAGIEQIIIISRGVPPLDMVYLLQKATISNTFILGSGSQGLLIPDKLWLGICEPQFYLAGRVGIISRTARLTDEVARKLTQSGLGQSIVVGLGTDAIIGASFEQWLQILEEDETTDAIVLLGQINSSAEMAAAEYIAAAIEKPVIAYLAGQNAPLERSLADATTIIANHLSSSVSTPSPAQKAIATFKQAKVRVTKRLSEIPDLLKKVLK